MYIVCLHTAARSSASQCGNQTTPQHDTDKQTTSSPIKTLADTTTKENPMGAESGLCLAMSPLCTQRICLWQCSLWSFYFQVVSLQRQVGTSVKILRQWGRMVCTISWCKLLSFTMKIDADIKHLTLVSSSWELTAVMTWNCYFFVIECYCNFILTDHLTPVWIGIGVTVPVLLMIASFVGAAVFYCCLKRWVQSNETYLVFVLMVLVYLLQCNQFK